MKRPTKREIIAIAALITVIVILVLMGAGEKLGRFALISQNIAVNLMHPTHGDERPLEQMSAAYIKANTGTTKIIHDAYLPAALKPIKEHAHSPFEMGACAICHSPNRSKPAAILTHTVSELCYRCHEPIGGIRHDAKELDCNRCHNPHHADKEKLIRNTVTQTVCPAGTFSAEETVPEMGEH